jgi:hypothetical protein
MSQQNSIPISPTVELQETVAHLSYFRNRSLIQAQAIAEAAARIAELERQIAEMQPPSPAENNEGAE